ncbi:shikimate kinase [Hathewaya histolytica]|uniref:Shikimate kinase n=1 Tax=Hathewaya histolytica TaxID=1498 RepID=A0A4U9R003_HATHI|nr:shikimate kinase [Hathewaya histolytica]VTQ84452.1 shikimate kinase [Hathewaya histolytica]
MSKNIVLIGMPGCGKSALGYFLSKRLNLDFIDLDRFIEKGENKKIPEIFESGEEYFRGIEEQYVEKVSVLKSTIISTGGGVIKREKNINCLKENGVLIFIDRPLDNIIKDIDIENRPLLKDKKDNLHKLYDDRYELYRIYGDYRVLNKGTLEETLNEVMEILKREKII